MATFEQAHPFRVPLPGGEHVRFTSLELAAGSAVEHTSIVVDERCAYGGNFELVYDNVECRRIHAERRV